MKTHLQERASREPEARLTGGARPKTTLTTLALHFLLRGPSQNEKYVFASEVQEALQIALTLLLERGEDIVEPLTELTRLAAVLEFQESSPGAADTLLSVVRTHPGAMEIAKRLAARKEPEDAAFIHTPRKAPHIEAKGPPGSLRVGQMVNQGDERTRAGGHRTATPRRPPSGSFATRKTKDRYEAEDGRSALQDRELDLDSGT
ncbi:MAG: hypothetical protein H6729_17415 [Deltaproteobacteria bacterium]|nr:hypothetical protein [Deltaproteobacteria bacterium]